VEDEQVEVAVLGGVGGGATVLHGQGREAGRLQTLLEELGDAGFVLGNQDAAHYSSIGIVIVNVVPSGLESTSSSPPWERAIAATIGRPRPAPVVVRRPTWPRVNRSNITACSLSGMPGPVSDTDNISWSPIVRA